jgi:hypothetical protein
MKRHWIEYRETSPRCPMTYWVHHQVGESDAQEYDPPKQAVVPGRGYPLFKVEFDGFIFEFSSLAEIRVCVEILGKKLLPRTIDLSRERGTGVGPNSHWLSRLPAHTKSWKYREKAVTYLQESLNDFG